MDHLLPPSPRGGQIFLASCPLLVSVPRVPQIERAQLCGSPGAPQTTVLAELPPSDPSTVTWYWLVGDKLSNLSSFYIYAPRADTCNS